MTPELLRAFIEKIVVHESEKVAGRRQQEIEIHYNFIGEIEPEKKKRQETHKFPAAKRNPHKYRYEQ